MFSQLYSPKKLDELDYNNELTNILKNIVKNGINQNLLYSGIRNTGKKTRIKCLLNDIYGNIKSSIQTTTIGKNLEIIYKSNQYYYELSPSDYGVHDKSILSEFIYPLALSSNVLTNQKKIFIILYIDRLSLKAQYILRNIIEKSYKTSWFICTCYDSSKILYSLLNKFMILRNSNPSVNDVTNILNNISKKNNYKISSRSINNIINSSKNIDGNINLLHSLNILQMSYIDNKYNKYSNKFIYLIDKLIIEIDKSDKKLKNISNIREGILLIYISNINMINVFQYILNTLIIFILLI